MDDRNEFWENDKNFRDRGIALAAEVFEEIRARHDAARVRA